MAVEITQMSSVQYGENIDDLRRERDQFKTENESLKRVIRTHEQMLEEKENTIRLLKSRASENQVYSNYVDFSSNPQMKTNADIVQSLRLAESKNNLLEQQVANLENTASRLRLELVDRERVAAEDVKHATNGEHSVQSSRNVSLFSKSTDSSVDTIQSPQLAHPTLNRPSKLQKRNGHGISLPYSVSSETPSTEQSTTPTALSSSTPTPTRLSVTTMSGKTLVGAVKLFDFPDINSMRKGDNGIASSQNNSNVIRNISENAKEDYSIASVDETPSVKPSSLTKNQKNQDHPFDQQQEIDSIRRVPVNHINHEQQENKTQDKVTVSNIVAGRVRQLSQKFDDPTKESTKEDVKGNNTPSEKIAKLKEAYMVATNNKETEKSVKKSSDISSVKKIEIVEKDNEKMSNVNLKDFKSQSSVVSAQQNDEYAQAQMFVEQVTGKKWTSNDFCGELKDGVKLCEMANSLSSNAIKKIHVNKPAMFMWENSAMFIAFYRQLEGIHPHLWQPMDLWEGKQLLTVARCILDIKKHFNK